MINRLNSYTFRSVSVFLIPFVIFYISGFFVVSAVWFSDSANAVEPEGGKIWGYKFEDLDGDGQRDEGEPVLNGWTIYLYDGDSVVTGEGEWPDGYYEFNNLDNDTYYICEELRDDWTQTYPNNNTNDGNNFYIYEDCNSDDETWSDYGYEVELNENQVENLNFGNFQYGYISGHKYSEETGDPIENWTIYLVHPNGETDNVSTNNEGEYEFSELGPGTYKVCESIDENEEDCAVHPYQTHPELFYTIEMRSNADGLVNSNYDFRNYTQGVVQTLKFKDFYKNQDPDLNMNGHQDENELFLAGWQMCLSKWFPYDDNEGGEWQLVDDECKLTDGSGWSVWTNLDWGLYRLEEENRVGWSHTADYYYEFELDEENIVYERKFGNVPNELEVIKFYDTNGNGDQEDNEEVLSGWEFCLYKIVWPGDEDSGPIYEPVFEDYCRKTGENGSALWSELEKGDYLVDEEERENWFHTNWGEEGRAQVEVEKGRVVERFGNVRNVIRVLKFWDKNQSGSYEPEEGDKTLSDWQMCLYNDSEEGSEPSCKNTDEAGWAIWEDAEEGSYRVVEEGKDGWVPTNTEDGRWSFEVENGKGEVLIYFGNDTTSIDAHKFYDINQNGEQDYWAENLLEPDIRGWKMCLYKWFSSGEEDGEWQLVGECKSTDDDGLAHWTGLAPDLYRLEEEGREVLGWSPMTDSSYVFELGYLENREFDFGNWIEDLNPPVSQFDQPRDHEVIDTEMVSLDLIGSSLDLKSGVRSAVMSVHQLGGPESVANYPAASFFDIFVELRCPIEPPREAPPLVPIELVSLSLVSVDPITVSWGHNWAPPSTGTYCFEVKAADYAGNVEDTAWAGPLAYVPVVQISDQESNSVSETSFTVEWDTDKPATSRVIYDTVSHLDLGEAPNYGYAFSTSEQDTDPKVTHHVVAITGLTAGTAYYYRTVSAASPESVGGESSTSTTSGGSGGNNGGSGGGSGSGTIIWSPSTPTPTPFITPTPSPSPSTVADVAGSAGGGNGVSGASTNATSNAGEELSPKSDLAMIGASDQPVPSQSESSRAAIGETEEESEKWSLFASISSLFGSVSLWWLLVLLVVVGSFAYSNRRKK